MHNLTYTGNSSICRAAGRHDLVTHGPPAGIISTSSPNSSNPPFLWKHFCKRHGSSWEAASNQTLLRCGYFCVLQLYYHKPLVKPTPLHCLHAIMPVPWQGLHCRMLPNCLLPDAACSSSNGTSRFPDPWHTKQRAPPAAAQLREVWSGISRVPGQGTSVYVWTTWTSCALHELSTRSTAARSR